MAQQYFETRIGNDNYALERSNDDEITIWCDNVYVGKGRVSGKRIECDANLDDKVYDKLESLLFGSD